MIFGLFRFYYFILVLKLWKISIIIIFVFVFSFDLIKYFCGQLCNRHFEKTAIWQLWIACVVRTITIKSKEIDETNTTTANTNGNTTRRLSASQAPRRIHGDDVKVVGRQFGPVEPRDVGRDRNAMRRYLGRLIVLSEKEGREVSSTYTLVYMARILLCCRQRTSPSGRPNKRCISSATNWCDYITSSEYTHTHTTAHVCLLVWHCGSVVATRQTASQTTAIAQTLQTPQSTTTTTSSSQQQRRTISGSVGVVWHAFVARLLLAAQLAQRARPTLDVVGHRYNQRNVTARAHTHLPAHLPSNLMHDRWKCSRQSSHCTISCITVTRVTMLKRLSSPLFSLLASNLRVYDNDNDSFLDSYRQHSDREYVFSFSHN